MKTHQLIFTCFLVMISYLAFAQVDDIKKGADSNKKKGSSHSSGNDSGGVDNACVEACCNVFGSEIFQIGVAALVEGQRLMLNAAVDDPTIKSIDFDPQAAYNPRYESYLILPRIRGTYGIFATDFRLNYLLGNGKYGTETFRTYEWQVLQLNLASKPHFNLRISSGVYWQKYLSSEPGEGYVTQSFNEHAAEMSIKFDNQKYITTVAGRIAKDYNTHNTVFSEISVIQNIRLIELLGLSGYFSFGLNIEQYYPSTRLLSIQAGLHFNLFASTKVPESHL